MRPCDIDRSGEVWLYRPFRFKTDLRVGAERLVALEQRANSRCCHSMRGPQRLSASLPKSQSNGGQVTSRIDQETGRTSIFAGLLYRHHLGEPAGWQHFPERLGHLGFVVVLEPQPIHFPAQTQSRATCRSDTDETLLQDAA